MDARVIFTSFFISSHLFIFFFFSDGFVSFIYSTPFGFLVEEKKRTGDIPLVYHFVPTSAQRRRRRQDCNKLLNRRGEKKKSVPVFGRQRSSDELRTLIINPLQYRAQTTFFLCMQGSGLVHQEPGRFSSQATKSDKTRRRKIEEREIR